VERTDPFQDAILDGHDPPPVGEEAIEGAPRPRAIQGDLRGRAGLLEQADARGAPVKATDRAVGERSPAQRRRP